MEGNDRRTILWGLGALLAAVMVGFRGGRTRPWLGAVKPGRPAPEPRPRIAPPEGSVPRHG